MRIRRKVLLTALISLAVALFCTLFIVKTQLLGYVDKEELNLVEHTYKGAVSILQKEKQTLENSEIDWAQWDDAYEFMKYRNFDFIDVNLQPETLNALKLQYMVFLDREYNLVTITSYANESNSDNSVARELLKLFKSNDFYSKRTDVAPITGVTVINGAPMLVSIAPVTDTAGTAPPNGYLIIARYINSDFIKYMEDVLRVKVTLMPPEKNRIKGEIQLKFADATLGSENIMILKDENVLRSYADVYDLLSARPISIEFKINRQLYRNGVSALVYFALIYSIALLLVAGFCITVFDYLVTHRIKKLHTFIDSVAVSRDMASRLNMGGKDEISGLAVNMNHMLEEIDSSYAELKARDERFRRIMETTNDGYFDANLQTGDIYVSPSWLKYLGYAEKGPDIKCQCH